jgi:hypothetical protein
MSLTRAIDILGLTARLDGILTEIVAQRAPRAPPAAAVIHELHIEVSARFAVALPPAPAPAGFASLTVADFPAFFAEFREKQFTLLWRGSCDGFGDRHFHGHCVGHAPSLTLIQDTEGNIFGGFTPVKWESKAYDEAASLGLG